MSVDRRRIAIVNWRDPWHPAAGGAERYAWELARGFVRRGARVRYVTSRAPGQRRRDRVDGVEFARMGGRFTVYPRVLAWMLLRRRAFDAVIDCQNGIPFFTPWVLPRRVPVFCSIFHVHDEQFGLYFPRWLAWAGRQLEGPVARWSYRRHACTVISPSTLTALRERLRWTGPAYLVPVGVSASPVEPAGEPGGDLVCVSRIVPHKRLERLLDVAAALRVPVHIVGDGPAAGELRDAIARRRLGDLVTLHGFLPEADKAALVARSALHLSASRGEGWGLCVAEAAAHGVPTVAYDVDGLRDAVRDGVTGWLVRDGERLEDVVERALKELAGPGRRAEVARQCRRWAAEFGWPRTVERMAGLVGAAIRTGSAQGTADGAVVVARRGAARARVVEGPVRDEIVADPEAIMEVRPATELERLLGRPE